MMREWLVREAEKFKYYLSLEKIRRKHDALFFNEIRRFFHEELIILLALLNWDKEKILQALDAREQRLNFLLAPLYQNCAMEFYSLDFSQKSIYGLFSLSNNVIEYRCRKIIETTKRYVEQAFNYPEQVREKITALYSGNGRVNRIARTEVNTASNLGLYEAALAQGKRFKIWICSREDTVRHGHRNLENEKVSIKERYSNGLLYPGDSKGTAGQVINCRCFQIFV